MEGTRSLGEHQVDGVNGIHMTLHLAGDPVQIVENDSSLLTTAGGGTHYECLPELTYCDMC